MDVQLKRLIKRVFCEVWGRYNLFLVKVIVNTLIFMTLIFIHLLERFIINLICPEGSQLTDIVVIVSEVATLVTYALLMAKDIIHEIKRVVEEVK